MKKFSGEALSVKFRRIANILIAVCVASSVCGCASSGQQQTQQIEFESLEPETKEESSEVSIADVSVSEAINEPVDSGSEETASEGESEETTDEEQQPSSDDKQNEEAQNNEEAQSANDSTSQDSEQVVSVTPVSAAPPSTAPVYVSETLTALENMHYSDEQMQQIINFYDGAVFAGDSVMLGFTKYAGKSDDPLLKKFKFLTAGSLSLHNSFWEVSDKSVHPLYQGAQHPIWESMQMMGANKAFLFFGINDVVYDMDESVSLYSQLVDKIREFNPGMDITVISATYTLKDMGKNKLNNTNLAEFNRRVQALASESGWGYIDMANVLSDGQGNLAPEYCSDGFLHENPKAYDVWTKMLIRYAADRLGLQETPVETPAEAPLENAQESSDNQTEAPAAEQ